MQWTQIAYYSKWVNEFQFMLCLQLDACTGRHTMNLKLPINALSFALCIINFFFIVWPALASTDWKQNIHTIP